MQLRVRVRSSKIEVQCASACETIIEVRVCVRHTVKFIVTQRLVDCCYTELKAFTLRLQNFWLRCVLNLHQFSWLDLSNNAKLDLMRYLASVSTSSVPPRQNVNCHRSKNRKKPSDYLKQRLHIRGQHT